MGSQPADIGQRVAAWRAWLLQLEVPDDVRSEVRVKSFER